MLCKQDKHKLFKSIVSTSALALLTSCGSSKALESFVSPDPQLVADRKTAKLQQTQAKPSAKKSNKEDVFSSENSQAEIGNTEENSQAKLNGQQNSLLPVSFPPSFPLYPEAELKEARQGENERSGMLTWDSSDNQKAIADHYEAELTANDWIIVKPFTFDAQQQLTRAIAVKGETRADLTLLSSSERDYNDKNNTQLSLIYQPIEQEIARSGISEAIDSTKQPNQVESESKPQAKNSEQQKRKLQPSKTFTEVKSDNTEEFNSSGVDFDDLDRVPEQLRDSLELVAALDILTPYTGNNNVELSKFAPNEVITKGEYARWLVEANNRYFEDDSGKKIYLATEASEPAFKDVKPSNPDFQAIQSLAEAGLIPSRLTEESTHLLFKPNASLKREDLVTWKVPLDMRESLPKATIQAIEESWGFQDAAHIESSANRALYADYQNGDRSNVRRIFGYTTLFQPKKPVTRAEAAASLWYFGFQGDGVTAREVLEAESGQ